MPLARVPHPPVCSPPFRLPVLAAIPCPGAPPGHGPESSPRSPHSTRHRPEPVAGEPSEHRASPTARGQGALTAPGTARGRAPGTAARTRRISGENTVKALRGTDTFQGVFPAEIKLWRGHLSASGLWRRPLPGGPAPNSASGRRGAAGEPAARPGRGRVERKGQRWLR